VTRKALLALQSKVAFAIETAADRSGTSRELDTLRDVIERQEREHRAFGRRMVGPAATRGAASIRAAVDHFVGRVVYEGITKYACGTAPIAELRGVRLDYVLGAILAADSRFVAALRAELGARFPGAAPLAPLAHAAGVDYCEVIASRGQS
jgi:hypothetical protein